MYAWVQPNYSARSGATALLSLPSDGGDPAPLQPHTNVEWLRPFKTWQQKPRVELYGKRGRVCGTCWGHHTDAGEVPVPNPERHTRGFCLVFTASRADPLHLSALSAQDPSLEEVVGRWLLGRNSTRFLPHLTRFRQQKRHQQTPAHKDESGTWTIIRPQLLCATRTSRADMISVVHTLPATSNSSAETPP